MLLAGTLLLAVALHASMDPLTQARNALARFELDKSSAYVDQALAEDEPSPEAYYIKARVETLNYRFDQGMKVSRQCIERFPEAALCFESLGEARALGLVREDRLLKQIRIARDSRGDLLHAVALDPNDIRARIQLIRFYAMAPFIIGGSERKARQQADAIARIDPARASEAYGMMYFYEENWKDAQKSLSAAVEQHPHFAELRYHLARALGEQGRLTDAVEELEKIVATSPQFWEAWFYLGVWCVDADADNAVCFKALDTFVKGAVDSGPSRLANAYYAMGKLREERGELKLALAAYEHALQAKHGHNESRAGVERLRPIVGES